MKHDPVEIILFILKQNLTTLITVIRITVFSCTYVDVVQVQEVSFALSSLLAHSEKAVDVTGAFIVETSDIAALSEMWTSSGAAAAAAAAACTAVIIKTVTCY